MNARIESIEYYLPESSLTNEMLSNENPSWDMDKVIDKTGVFNRPIASEKETALSLALRACKNLFKKQPKLKDQIDILIFCTQSPDYIMPPNSCVLHKHLELKETITAFDFNLACSGFIYGSQMAQAYIAGGLAKKVLLVTADTYSKYINKQDRSIRTLFGDGACVTVYSGCNEGGISRIQCNTYGEGYENFIIRAGAAAMPKSEETSKPIKGYTGNIRTLENIHMNGANMLSFVTEKVPKDIYNLMEKTNTNTNDYKMFVFHQASKVALDTLEKKFELKPEQTYRNLETLGNLVSSSIPVAIKMAMDEGRLKKGDKILLSGFGVGLSYGCCSMVL